MALWHAPHGPVRGVVLYIHPFAEEMNKTRRMAALQARALAAVGFGVLQIDLKGCGDSSGEFGDARWYDWVADVHTGMRWLRQKSAAPLTLWGLRAGCLLAAEAAAQWTHDTCNFVFWQPTPNGAAVLRQFLRTAAAAAFLDGGGKGVVDGLRRQLAADKAIEVGGYRVHPELACGLERAQLTLPSSAGRVAWFEISALAREGGLHLTLPTHPSFQTVQTAPMPLLPMPSADTAPAAVEDAALSMLSPAMANAAAPWLESAQHFEALLIAGPPFWQTAEIEVAPGLLDATTAALASAGT